MEAFDEKPVTPWPLWVCVPIQIALFLAVGSALIFMSMFAFDAVVQLF